jgi:CelD/BcsL family acetyltransferase involved in cellulose biosynthesis
LAPAQLRLQRISDPVGFAALRAEWDELLDSSESGVFSSWEWLYPWFCRVGRERDLQIVTARGDSGKLIGLMPLSLERRHLFGRPVRRLSFLGDARVGSEYLGVIAPKGLEARVAAEIAASIRTASDWDVFDLLDLPEQSSTLSVFREAFLEPDFVTRLQQRSICPYQSFTASETFDRYLRGTSRRDNYLRRRRWLEQQSGYRIDREGDPERLTLPLAEFFRLHTLRWEGDSDGVAGPAVEAFHRDAVQLLAERGQVRLYTLRIGDRALASVYAILYGRKFIFYQSGYDPQWRNKSVGLVLLGETFRDCIESGYLEYDFLRGTEPYKLEWATQQRRTMALRIFRKGSVGEWFDRTQRAAAASRKIIQGFLPDRWIERIRARRRSAVQGRHPGHSS